MDKPFKTIEEQIAILRSRGMETGDDTPKVLEREGYYSVVNGYKDPFIDAVMTMRNGEDTYFPGTRFDELYALFCFDRDLRMTMMRYFAMAEATLKTVCSYQFAKAYGTEPFAYLDPSNYREDTAYSGRVNDLIRDFEQALGRDPEHPPKKKEYMQHYLDNHDEVPIWVILRYMMFGQAFKFFEFQEGKVRNEIARSYSELYSETHDGTYKMHVHSLRLIYDHVKDFRNICAHDERLYCARVAPSKDIPLGRVIDELGCVLTKEADSRMVGEVVNLITGIGDKLGKEKRANVMNMMGIVSLDNLSAIRE